nr:WYL domain-containing protein [Luteimonas sp. BDR2-5]
MLGLLQSRRFWPGAELAARLGVTPRTVRRDIDRLRSLGYPVRASAGPAGGYALAAGAALPPLLLDDDEALAVALGLRLATMTAVTGLEDAGLRALAKLEQVLPTRLRRRVRGLHAAMVPLGMVGPAVDAERLSALAGACRDRVRAAFAYRGNDGRRSERDVEPHALVCSAARWYLLAWDCGRGDWRTFRVDRIGGRLQSGPRFLPRPIPDGDAAAYVSRAVGSDPYAVRARVVLHAPLARMAERIPPLAGRLTALADDRCLLETGAQAVGMLAVWIAGLGVEFEVLAPQELAGSLEDVAARLQRAAGRSTAASPLPIASDGLAG